MNEVRTASFINIGERTNVTGSAKFKKLIMADDFDAALAIFDNVLRCCMALLRFDRLFIPISIT